MQNNRKRNHQFSIRISDAEQALWDKKQKASGLSKTEYFIRMLKGSVIKVYYFSEVISALYHELRKIGVNLNQLAYHSNIGNSYQAGQALKDMSAEYGEVMKRISNFLERPLINAVVLNADNIPDSFNPLESKGGD